MQHHCIGIYQVCLVRVTVWSLKVSQIKKILSILRHWNINQEQSTSINFIRRQVNYDFFSIIISVNSKISCLQDLPDFIIRWIVCNRAKEQLALIMIFLLPENGVGT